MTSATRSLMVSFAKFRRTASRFPMNPRSRLRSAPHHRFAALAFALTVGGPAMAAAPLYHLTVLTVPDATTIQVQDINDAGQTVGRYLDAEFNARAALWDADGTVHTLGQPGVGDAGADAINNLGQIVGTFNDYQNPQVGLLWDASTPSQSVPIGTDTSVYVAPRDINDAGIVVGGFGLPAQERAFVWSTQTGLVDYGIQDTSVEFQQARWSALNNAGKLVGHWNQHSSNIHATVGQVGTPAVLPMSEMTEAFASVATALNGAGVAVGVGLAAAAPKLVPVVFASDGSYSEIAGATFDLGNGCAAAINDSGVIVGSAGIGTASGCVPGGKAWVYRDGAVHDLFDVVDDHGIFTNFQIGLAINAAGVIVGTGRTADNNVASFVLTPIVSEVIFADGYDG
jgi:hypothetical protein